MTPAQIISAIFGKGWSFVRGFDPSANGHHGWDISAAPGTPVPALTGGTVIFAENAGGGGGIYATPYRAPDSALSAARAWATGGGNTIEVLAPDGTIYQYAHLSAFSVHVGDTVTAGQQLGQVGQTGDATGPHLHFAMIKSAPGRGIAGKVSPVSWIDPSAFLTSLSSSGASFNLLGAWGNVVAFPTGHVLTVDDVNRIIAQLDAVHFFQSTSNIPGLQQLAENAARDQTRAILMQHVGQAWTPDLQKQLQTQFFGAATAAVTNPIQSLADVAGKLIDPMTYVHTGALLIGLFLAYKGFRWALEQSGASAEPVG